MLDSVQSKLDSLPAAPGVYLFKDRAGELCYVGKASNLRSRVRSYFHRGGDDRFFVRTLDEVLGDIEAIVTQNEKEALILENTLIKRHRPRFNVVMRDDKDFLAARIDPHHEWPRVELLRARNIRDDGALTFGPFHAAHALRETLRVANRHFQLRVCSDHVLYHRTRPCILYQMKRCPAPCVHPVDRDWYASNVRAVTMLLEGKAKDLCGSIETRMREAAGRLEYERAAVLRDQLRAVRRSMTKQSVVSGNRTNRDVVGFHRQADRVEIQVLSIRDGRLVGSQGFSFEGMEFPDEEVLSSFVVQYYEGARDLPREVLLPLSLEDAPVLAALLSERGGGRSVQLRAPLRGEGKRLVEMAQANARASFETRGRAEEDRQRALERLQARLRLRRLPVRIECFDMAHLQGTAAVGSCVAFEDGVPDKARYRHYKVQVANPDDDFGMIREVMGRRLKRGLDEGDLPDLVVVDGGKGQLGIAEVLLHELGVEDLDLLGLAKARPAGVSDEGAVIHGEERVFLPGQKNPIVLKPNSAELFLLVRIRDEAHRFANTFHARLRGKRVVGSALDGVSGVGPGRRRALLRHFGSLRRLAEASLVEITAVRGMSRAAATAVYAFLHPPPTPRGGGAPEA